MFEYRATAHRLCRISTPPRNTARHVTHGAADTRSSDVFTDFFDAAFPQVRI